MYRLLSNFRYREEEGKSVQEVVNDKVEMRSRLDFKRYAWHPSKMPCKPGNLFLDIKARGHMRIEHCSPIMLWYPSATRREGT